MQHKLPTISGDHAIKCFQKMGYEVVRQRGSHIRMQHTVDKNKKPLTIPRHRALGRGLLRKLIRDAEITMNSLFYFSKSFASFLSNS